MSKDEVKKVTKEVNEIISTEDVVIEVAEN